jgi:hypothetical protein
MGCCTQLLYGTTLASKNTVKATLTSVYSPSKPDRPVTSCLEGRFTQRVNLPLSLIRAGLLIVWLQLNVPGFRRVLARGWHGG